MTNFATRLFTMRYGTAVGEDEFGNRYFRHKNKPSKRWVTYAKAVDPTSVPPEWHRWLHGTTDKTPSEAPLPRQSWEKPFEPNHTGSADAYLPQGHLLATGERPKATGDYEPWTPS
ncbi:NADH:ubiquinone oxidoreductase subunit NDUFA12 [Tistrella bauzanensis]|uniref:NADH:ubiquinone oxidoreductase subunit NDUFA12 n=2 Tax=Tistrella TaxID=171436 RepID=A0ABU9YPN8_9PROT|nr:NADH:ubiquinone oxidoreductase subunit NDUFA12 [Tistrella bauzanensis]GGB39867.1 NADH dehydrogenase [Tistrella bauzanensis]